MSHRYPGYLRVVNADYRRALVETIQEDGRELIVLLGLADTLERLRACIDSPKAHSAAARLTKGILEEAGSRTPMELSGTEFNLAAERYYRTGLRKRHIREALRVLEEDVRQMAAGSRSGQEPYRRALGDLFGEGCRPCAFLERFRSEVEAETASVEVITRLIHLTLLTIHADAASLHRDDRSPVRHV
jgi:hypothetical protein